MQSRVVKLAKQGAPSVMTVETVELGVPGPDEVLIKQNIIGPHIQCLHSIVHIALCGCNQNSRMTPVAA